MYPPFRATLLSCAVESEPPLSTGIACEPSWCSFPPCRTSASSSPAAWVDAHLPELGGVRSEQPLGGSGWSSTFLLDTASGRRLFVKTSPQRDGAMFRGEALGLKAMEGTVDRMCC